MTPETRRSLIIDYLDGELSDGLLCGKYGLSAEQLKTAVYIGTGSIIKPEPLTRGMTRGVRNSVGVDNLARQVLKPEEMALSPLQSCEIKESPLEQVSELSHDERVSGLYLTDAELTFCNNVLRGMKQTPAAASAFEIYNEHLASRKASELMRSDNVRDYLGRMKGRSLFAPVRNKAYMEAVLWQVIDRSAELRQKFNVLTGQPVEGVCEYNPKMLIAAAALLARLKGWDNPTTGGSEQETQRDRLRRLQASYGVSRDDEA